MAGKGKGKQIPSKRGNKNTSCTPQTHASRKRTRSQTDAAIVAQQSGSPREIQKVSKVAKGATSVSKKIQFVDNGAIAQNNMGITINNNATPSGSTSANMPKQTAAADFKNDDYAKSDPTVVDPRLNDGVEVEVDPNESDFGTESDSDNEVTMPGTVNHVVTGTSTETSPNGNNSIQQLVQGSDLKKWFDEMMDEKLKNAKKEWEAEQANTKGMHTPNKVVKTNTRDGTVTLIKSPSDTTIYRPAVQRLNSILPPVPVHLNRTGQVLNVTAGNVPTIQPMIDQDIETRVSNFVEAIRVNDGPVGQVGQVASPGPSRQPDQLEPDDLYQEAQKRAEKTILEAEKYKALIANPPGENYDSINNMNETLQVRDVGSGLTDDDFFHLTCHIEPSLVSKIEKGEFIDLDKLLPKDKKKRSEDNRMEWVHSEGGGTYLAPVADRVNRISGYRKWEQAFRVYATIFCGANPHRSKEIWQYVSVINTAATSYIWENVYEYDVTFRHLMAFNPARSWAVTYNQMWNLCMKDPLTPKGNPFNKGYGGSHHNGYSGGGSQGQRASATGGPPRKKGRYCWYFNRGEKCIYGKKCRFIEKCSCCDATTHGVNTCPKLEGKPKPVTPNEG